MCLTDLDVALAIARDRVGRLAKTEIPRRKRGDHERDPADDREPVVPVAATALPVDRHVAA
jgi:hypothetical protein